MNTVWIVMPILLLLMFLLGTELKYNAFANVARNPRALIVGIVGQIIVLPAIAFALSCALNLPAVYLWELCSSRAALVVAPRTYSLC